MYLELKSTTNGKGVLALQEGLKYELLIQCDNGDFSYLERESIFDGGFTWQLQVL